MDILPLGHSSFKLRGKQATLVTDPYDAGAVGLKFPKNTEADIVTVSHSHPDHSMVAAVIGTPFVVNGPGEYEIKGISVIGIATFHDAEDGKARGKNTAYRIEIDGVRFAHLGDLGHQLSAQQIDILDGLDVLFVPVGGLYTIDAKLAATVVGQIDPKIVIPMHYQTPALKADLAEKLAPVSVFLKEMGKEGVTAVPKLTVTKDKLPAEMQVVVLE